MVAPLLIKRKWRGKRRLRRSSVEDIRPLKVSTVSTPSSKNPVLSVSPKSYKTKEREKVYQFQSRMVVWHYSHTTEKYVAAADLSEYYCSLTSSEGVISLFFVLLKYGSSVTNRKLF